MTERVVVIAGGLSAERDVSIRSGRRVAEELRQVGFDANVSDVDSGLLDNLMAHPDTVAIPLVHGAAGEDGSLQEVLDLVGVPYVGSTADACRQAFDKSVANTLVRGLGVNVPDSVALPQSIFRDLGAPNLLPPIAERLGFPLVVKPNRGGSALGLSIVASIDELPSAMVAAFAYSDVVLLQQFIVGSELAIGMFESTDGVRSLPAVEIVPDSGAYDYAARYTAGSTEFFVPARLNDNALAAADKAALAAYNVLGLRDWGRVDLVVDEAGAPWFLEANVAPGMTETSLIPLAITASDTTMGDVLGPLVRHAASRTATIQ